MLSQFKLSRDGSYTLQVSPSYSDTHNGLLVSVEDKPEGKSPGNQESRGKGSLKVGIDVLNASRCVTVWTGSDTI